MSAPLILGLMTFCFLFFGYLGVPVAFSLLAWLGLAAWAAITFLASTATGSTAAAAGIGFGALIVLSLLSAIPNVGRFLPGGLAEPATALAVGAPVATGDVLVPAVSTVVIAYQ